MRRIYGKIYRLYLFHLKIVEGITFETALYRFVEIIGREAERFCFLEDSDKLTVNEKERYKALIRLDNGRYSMDTDILASSLKMLSEFLYKHYGKKDYNNYR